MADNDKGFDWKAVAKGAAQNMATPERLEKLGQTAEFAKAAVAGNIPTASELKGKAIQNAGKILVSAETAKGKLGGIFTEIKQAAEAQKPQEQPAKKGGLFGLLGKKK